MNPTKTTTTNGGGSPAPTFDPRPYLRPLNGKQYLEVVHRLQWLRAEHPDAVITTTLQHFNWEAGWFIFHARVEIPGLGVAEGTGSETRDGFPGGPCEKAETIAIGRALAALGYGTAFCLDFETADANGAGHLADSPVETRTNGNGNGTIPHELHRALAEAGKLGPEPPRPSSNLATPAQLKLIYLTATRDLHITEEELEARCQAQYGRLPLQLTKREASEFIDTLKAGANARTAR